MRKKVFRKVAGCLLIACVYVPIIGFSVWKNGFSDALFGLLLCVVIVVILNFGVLLLCQTDDKMGEPEEDHYYTRETIKMMRSIRNERILRCIYIFVKDIIKDIREDAKGHE